MSDDPSLARMYSTCVVEPTGVDGITTVSPTSWLPFGGQSCSAGPVLDATGTPWGCLPGCQSQSPCVVVSRIQPCSTRRMDSTPERPDAKAKMALPPESSSAGLARSARLVSDTTSPE